jgi:hypothetical protein
MPCQDEEVTTATDDHRVHQGQNTVRTCDFDLYDHSNQDIIARFYKNKIFSHHKFLHPLWKDYSPSDKNSLCYKCNKEIVGCLKHSLLRQRLF